MLNSLRASQQRFEHKQRPQVVAKLQVTGLVSRPASGRPCRARTADNIDLVDELVLQRSG